MTDSNGRYPPRLTREQLRALLDRKSPPGGAWRGVGQHREVVPDPTGQPGYIVQQEPTSAILGASEKLDCARCEAAEAARDALAEECAELRQRLDGLIGVRLGLADLVAAVNAEREACAKVAEGSVVPGDVREPVARAIAAAIRARGETYGAVALSQSAVPAAQERPQGGDAGKAPPAPHLALADFTANATRQHAAAVERCLEWFQTRQPSLVEHGQAGPERRTEVHADGATLAYVWSRLVGGEWMTQTADAVDCNYVAPWNKTPTWSPLTATIGIKAKTTGDDK